MLQLSHSALIPALGSLIGAELRLSPLELERLDTGTLITGDSSGAVSLAVDSFQFIGLAGAVTRFFQLQDSGLEDYLLRYQSLGEWAEVVETARRNGAKNIAFSSSGTTGPRKTCVHAWASLEAEAHFFADLLSAGTSPPPGRILSLVPGHHIYGFLFGVLLPVAMERPVLGGLKAISCAQSGRLREGDIIVGFPFIWRQLAEQCVQFPPGVTGLTSTGPCDSEVIEQLQTQGLERMLEIYGASETGGIGYRCQPQEAFELLPRWERGDADHQLLDRVAGGLFDLEDRVQWQGPRRLIPQGRKDLAVQVGGTNVYPQSIAQQLESLPEVTAAAVRPTSPSQERLKAFIVPAQSGADSEALRAQLGQWCAQHLSPAETPQTFTFGRTLPRNAMGKLQDWT